MEYNNLKTIGKIYEFDGEAGTIITKDSEYMFNSDNIKSTEVISPDEVVSFYPSTVKFGNEIYNVAREIETLPKSKVKRPQK